MCRELCWPAPLQVLAGMATACAPRGAVPQELRLVENLHYDFSDQCFKHLVHFLKVIRTLASLCGA